MLLDLESEMARAADGLPFKNSDAAEAWVNLWCLECSHFGRCALLTVAMLGRTPAAWRLREPDSLNRYTCDEHDDVYDYGESSSEPTTRDSGWTS